MNVTLTLNEISVDQAERILSLVKQKSPESENENKQAEPAEGVPLFDDEPDKKPTADIKTDYAVEDVRKALAELSRTKGKDTAKGLLAKFGAAKVTELKPERFAEVMKAVGEVD